MSVITPERPAVEARPADERVPGTRRRPLRRPQRLGRGSGRTTRPQAQPPRPVRGPRLAPGSTSVGHGCQPPAPQPVASSWRLTDRGIALVLATGLAIATAALVVIGLTAFRVTGDSYRPTSQISGQVSAPAWGQP